VDVETHLAQYAAILAGGATFAGFIRWLIVAALTPRLAELHKRIDDHMTVEEREAAEQRALHVELAAHLKHTSEFVKRLDEVVHRVDERTARNESQLAWILGKMEQPQ
jgi:hypothetical protein